MAAAMPDRPYGMNHPFARQLIALRDLRIARLAAMERPALREELRPRRLMDRAIHPAPTQKCRAGGIHDGIDFHFCNIVSNDLKWHGFHPFWSRVCRCLKENTDEILSALALVLSGKARNKPLKIASYVRMVMTKHGMKTHAKSDSAILSAFPSYRLPAFALSILSIGYFLNH